MGASRQDTAANDRDEAVSAALAELARPGIHFSPVEFAAGSLFVIAGLIGLVCIELIMLGSARRLELKQVERYGTDAAYQAYAARVPVLLPLVPLYSLRRLRVYLG